MSTFKTRPMTIDLQNRVDDLTKKESELLRKGELERALFVQSLKVRINDRIASIKALA